MSSEQSLKAKSSQSGGEEIRVVSHPPAAEPPRVKLEGAELANAIRTKVEYYLSKENLQTDTFLVSKMTNDMWIDVSVIAQFRAMLTIGADEAQIVEAVKSLDSVLLSQDQKSLKPNIKVERKTLIIRDIPADAEEDEIAAIFSHLEGENAPVQTRKEVGDNLFVTFADEERCLQAHASLAAREFRGKPVRGRVKSETLVKSFYQPAVPVQTFVYPPNYYPNGMYMMPRGGSFGRGAGRGGMRPPRDGRDKGRINKKKPGQPKRPGQPPQQQLHLGPQNFPPLPTEGAGSSERTGYGTSKFYRYEIKEVLGVLEKMPRDLLTSKPAFLTHEVVVLDEASLSPSSEVPLTWEESSAIFAQVDQTPLDRTSHSPFVSPLFVHVHTTDMLPEIALPPAATATSYAHVTQQAATLAPGFTRSLRVPSRVIPPPKPIEGETAPAKPVASAKSPAKVMSASVAPTEKPAAGASSSFKDILLANKAAPAPSPAKEKEEAPKQEKKEEAPKQEKVEVPAAKE